MYDDSHPLVRKPGEKTPDGSGVLFRHSPSEANILLYIMGGVYLLAFAVAMIAGWNDKGAVPWIELLILTGAFTPVMGVMIYNRVKVMNDPGAQIVIMPDHIRIPNLLSEPVPWDAIERIAKSEAHYKGTRQNVYLLFFLVNNDVDRFGGHLGSRWRRKLARWQHDTDLVIGLEGLEGEPEDVIDALKQFAPSALLARSDL